MHFPLANSHISLHTYFRCSQFSTPFTCLLHFVITPLCSLNEVYFVFTSVLVSSLADGELPVGRDSLTLGFQYILAQVLPSVLLLNATLICLLQPVYFLESLTHPSFLLPHHHMSGQIFSLIIHHLNRS